MDDKAFSISDTKLWNEWCTNFHASAHLSQTLKSLILAAMNILIQPLYLCKNYSLKYFDFYLKKKEKIHQIPALNQPKQ